MLFSIDTQINIDSLRGSLKWNSFLLIIINRLRNYHLCLLNLQFLPQNDKIRLKVYSTRKSKFVDWAFRIAHTYNKGYGTQNNDTG